MRIVAVTYLGHVPNSNSCAIDGFDRQLVQRIDPQRKGVNVDLILFRAEFDCAAGEDQCLRVDRARDVALRQIFFLKLSKIEINRDEPLIRNRDPWYGNQSDTQLVERNVGCLLFGNAVAADTILKNGDVGCAVLNDKRRRRSGWQLSQDRLRNGGDLGDGC